MADKEGKKQVPLRLSPKLYDALAAWAEEDFRSVNGQIEYLLTECVRQRAKNGAYTPAFPRRKSRKTTEAHNYPIQKEGSVRTIPVMRALPVFGAFPPLSLRLHSVSTIIAPVFDTSAPQPHKKTPKFGNLFSVIPLKNNSSCAKIEA